MDNEIHRRKVGLSIIRKTLKAFENDECAVQVYDGDGLYPGLLGLHEDTVTITKHSGYRQGISVFDIKDICDIEVCYCRDHVAIWLFSTQTSFKFEEGESDG
jgi:hypothetical protein